METRGGGRKDVVLMLVFSLPKFVFIGNEVNFPQVKTVLCVMVTGK